MEGPRVMEIKVRIDCNGCIQKIKKALQVINGINDIYIDIPQQKLTIFGSADPEKVVKAIKKTRKLAIVFSDTQPSPPTDPPLDDGCVTPFDSSNPSPKETVSPHQPTEPQEEPENSPLESESKTAPVPKEPPTTHSKQQSPHLSRSIEAEQIHVVHHYTPDHGHRNSHERVSVEHYSSSPRQVYKHEPPQSVHVKRSYNTYRPTPVVTDFEYIRSPPQYTHYSRAEPPQQFAHYNKPEPTPQQTHCTELPRQYTNYNRAEPPPQQTHYIRAEPQQQTHHARPEPPQETHCTRPEQPQYYTHYNRPEPPLQQTHYARPEPPQHYTHYRKPEPPLQYTHYQRPQPPSQSTQYNRPEPPHQYTNYGREELSGHYTNYSEYHSSSNGNGNITSIFSDENPNACTIV